VLPLCRRQRLASSRYQHHSALLELLSGKGAVLWSLRSSKKTSKKVGHGTRHGKRRFKWG
jgi:hypothetical protein